MHPPLRQALITAGCVVVAAALGWQIADGAYFWPSVAAVIALGALLVRLLKLSLDVIVCGWLLVGYIVGNRGFAQLMPAPGLPLLPAETGLLLAVGWRTIRCAFERQLPFRRDALNWAVLAWLVAGTVRVIFDVPRFGFLAVRDYAMIYYAVFFFLAQHMGREPAARRYLIGCLLIAVVALLPMFTLFESFPDFFMNQFTVFHVPVIYYKGDLVATHLAAGSLVIFHWARGPQRYWAWPLSAGMFLFVASWDSRASLFGAGVASLLLLLTGRWRFPALQGGLAAVALLAAIGLATLFDNSWAERKLHGLTDRLHSMVDVTGSRRYQSQDSFNKGDNNRFRLVWWKNVATETWDTNPVFGLGFGADLAQGFVQEYYANAPEDFSARSPHNIFLTAFGRMGLVGVAVWVVFCGVLLGRTWHALRRSSDPVLWSLWCATWVILCSATFGVVLEGPMGAVIFWTLLGLAHAWPPETAETALPVPAEEALRRTAVKGTTSLRG